jgi:hypothetical protein
VTHRHPQPPPQPDHQPIRQASGVPPLEERVHRLPGREVHRQRPPLHRVLGHVADRVEHRPRIMTHRAPAPTTAKLGHQLLGLRSQHLPLRVGDVRRVARGAASTPASQHRTTGRLGRDKVHRTRQGLLDSGVGSTTPPLPEAPAHTSPRHADVIKPLLAHPTAPDESPVVCQQALRSERTPEDRPKVIRRARPR